MTDKTFVRFGIIFIVLTPILMTPYYTEKTAKRWEDGTKIDGYSQDQNQLSEWLTPSMLRHRISRTESYNLFLSRVARRNIILSGPLDPDSLKLSQYPVGYLRWLVADLEARPYAVKYDLKCIRLLGAVKNYLKSLDSVESSGILEVLPEKTNEDKQC